MRPTEKVTASKRLIPGESYFAKILRTHLLRADVTRFLVLIMQGRGYSRKAAESWVDRALADAVNARLNLSLWRRLQCISWGFLPPTVSRFEITKQTRSGFISEREYAFAHPLNGKYDKWVRDRISTHLIFQPYSEHFERMNFQLLSRDGELLIIPLNVEASRYEPSIYGLLRFLDLEGPGILAPSVWRNGYRASIRAYAGKIIIEGNSYSPLAAKQLLTQMVRNQFYVVLAGSDLDPPTRVSDEPEIQPLIKAEQLRITVAMDRDNPVVVSKQLVQTFDATDLLGWPLFPIGAPTQVVPDVLRGTVQSIEAQSEADLERALDRADYSFGSYPRPVSPATEAGPVATRGLKNSNRRVKERRIVWQLNDRGEPVGRPRALLGRAVYEVGGVATPPVPASWDAALPLVVEMCRFAPQLKFVEFTIDPRASTPLITGVSPLPVYGRIFPFTEEMVRLVRLHASKKRHSLGGSMRGMSRVAKQVKLRIRRRFARKFYRPGLVPYQSVRWIGDVLRDLFSASGVPLHRRVWAYRNGFLSYRLAQYGITEETVGSHISDFDYRWLRHPNRKYKYLLEDKISIKYVAAKHAEFFPKYYFHGQLQSAELEPLMDLPAEHESNLPGLLRLLRQEGQLALKPEEGSHGAGFQRLEWDGRNYRLSGDPIKEAELEKFLANQSSRYLVTEFIEAHPDFARLYPDSVNTLRMIVFKKDGLQAQLGNAYLRVGSSRSGLVDNTSAGGIVARVDIDTGTYREAKMLRRGLLVDCPIHPDTGMRIEGTVPHWERVCATVLEIADSLPQLEYLGFDVAVTPTGIKLPEINRFPDYPRVANFTASTTDYLLYKLAKKKAAYGLHEQLEETFKNQRSGHHV